MYYNIFHTKGGSHFKRNKFNAHIRVKRNIDY